MHRLTIWLSVENCNFLAVYQETSDRYSSAAFWSSAVSTWTLHTSSCFLYNFRRRKRNNDRCTSTLFSCGTMEVSGCLLLLLVPVLSLCGATEYYVRPTEPTNTSCPAQPCLSTSMTLTTTSSPTLCSSFCPALTTWTDR